MWNRGELSVLVIEEERFCSSWFQFGWDFIVSLFYLCSFIASEVLLAVWVLSSVQEQPFNGVEFTVFHKYKPSVPVFPKIEKCSPPSHYFETFHALLIPWTSWKEFFNPLMLIKCFLDQRSLGRRGRCKTWAVRRTSRRQHRETCWKASCGASRYDRESLRFQECYSINKVTWFCLGVWI